MKSIPNTYYYIPNTCDEDNLTVEGELFVLLDSNFNPIYYHDHSDFHINIQEQVPKDLLTQIPDFATAYLKYFKRGTKKQYKAIDDYLFDKGYNLSRIKT